MIVEKACGQCGQGVSCGRDAERCWCGDLPHLPSTALELSADCLCPACLRERLNRHTQAHAADLDDGDDRPHSPA